MTLKLAQPGRYTDAQILAAAHGQEGRISSRLDAYTIGGSYIDTIDTLAAESGAFRWEVNVDQDVAGSLHIEFEPHRLLTTPAKILLRPFLELHMPDGGRVDVPRGGYVFMGADRHSDESGTLLRADCPDITHLLDKNGPDAEVTWPIGTRWVTIMNWAIASAGFPEYQLPASVSGETTTKNVIFALRTPRRITRWEQQLSEFRSQQGTAGSRNWGQQLAHMQVLILRRRLLQYTVNDHEMTYLMIVNMCADALGWDHLWFDWNVRPRMAPAPALTFAQRDLRYTADDSSIIEWPFDTSADLDRVKTHVTVVPTGADAALLGIQTADANQYAPTHPMASRNLGRALRWRAVFDESNATSPTALKARAVRELRDLLGIYETAAVGGWTDPSHEARDVVGLPYDGNGAEVLYLTKRLSGEGTGDCGQLMQAERIYGA